MKKIKESLLIKIFLCSVILFSIFLVWQNYGEDKNDADYDADKLDQIVDNALGDDNKEHKLDVSNQVKTTVWKVKSGDNIGGVLGKNKIESVEIYEAISALKKVFKTTSLKKDDKIYISYKELNKGSERERRELTKVKIYVTDTRQYVVTRNNDGSFFAEKKDMELFTRLQVKSGEITSSLYQDAVDEGIPVPIVMEFIKSYGFDIDFQRDIRKGDKFQVFYETFYNEEGEFIKNGDIIYSKFLVNGKSFANYKYTTTKGATLYFNEQGSSVKKALLRTPINGARLSSGFGYRRHPILGYNKLHTGVDFAARTGTPILAAGNGRVEKIGWYGGYGRYVRIKHNGTYKTAYAHMSRFKKGLKVGSRVKQGEVIGYVGSSGRSTGPHLHYEVHRSGKVMNPRRLKAQSKVTLKGKELDKFQSHRNRIDFILHNAFAEARI